MQPARIAPDIGILTATPDLVAQGLMPELLQRLSSAGLAVVAAQPHTFTAAEAFLLYDNRITNKRGESRVHSNWLSPRYLTAGPCVVLWCASAGPAETSVQERMVTLKGGSRIGAAVPGELRAMSAQCDRSFSLVHCPDDEGDMARETRLVFGPAFLDAVRAGSASRLADRFILRLAGLPEPGPDHRTLSALPEVLGLVAACLACDPEIDLPTGELAEAVSCVDTLAESLAGPGDLAGLERVLWESVCLIAPVFERAWRRIDALCHAELPVQSFCRLSARRVLARLAWEACTQAQYDTWLSHKLAEATQASHLKLGHWNVHRLHLIAAYHSGLV